YEVQKLLGHSSISVTQIYSHLASSELHGAVNKISIPLNRPGERGVVVRGVGRVRDSRQNLHQSI
ncbi:MAG: hypothetical protein V3T23_10755, partial [Nitrososphaerales archaeon]